MYVCVLMPFVCHPQVQQAMSLCQHDPTSAAVQMMKEARRNLDTEEEQPSDLPQAALG